MFNRIVGFASFVMAMLHQFTGDTQTATFLMAMSAVNLILSKD